MSAFVAFWFLCLFARTGVFAAPDCLTEPCHDVAYASIFYVGTPRDREYFLALRVMFGSLKETNPNADLVALTSPDVPIQWKQQLNAEGIRCVDVGNLANPYIEYHEDSWRFIKVMNKLWAWTLVQYKKVVLLDSDNLFLRNIDELFHCGSFCAVFINPCIFHTGLVVLEPSMETFNSMVATVEELAQKDSGSGLDNGDQGFLNSFFSNLLEAPLWRDTQNATGIYRLPFGYQMDHVFFYPRFRWELPCSEKSVVTFPGLSFMKPWYWWSWPLLRLASEWQDTRYNIVGVKDDAMECILPFAVYFVVFWIFVKAIEKSMLRCPCTQYSKFLSGHECGLGIKARIASFIGLFLCYVSPLFLIPSTLHPYIAWSAYFTVVGVTLLTLQLRLKLPWAIFGPWIVILLWVCAVGVLPFPTIFHQLFVSLIIVSALAWTVLHCALLPDQKHASSPKLCTSSKGM